MQLNKIEKMLSQELDQPMSFDEACKYLNLSKSYLYKCTHKNLIPYYKPGGKKIFFSKKYYKYAGVVTDIIYDHFLTKEWNFFSRRPLESVTYNFYRALVNNYDILPDKVRDMMPFFIINNWIESYQTLNGIKHVLKTLSSHTTLPKQTGFAMRILKKNYFSLQDDFMEFFPQLIDYVEKDFGIHISHRITIPF